MSRQQHKQQGGHPLLIWHVNEFYWYPCKIVKICPKIGIVHWIRYGLIIQGNGTLSRNRKCFWCWLSPFQRHCRLVLCTGSTKECIVMHSGTPRTGRFVVNGPDIWRQPIIMCTTTATTTWGSFSFRSVRAGEVVAENDHLDGWRRRLHDDRESNTSL